MSKIHKGSCLCGKVKLTVSLANTDLGACHCGMCRKWSSGPFMAIEYSGDMLIEGEQYIRHYNSSEWAERGFCQECGSNLYYHLKGTKDYGISAWIFDDITTMPFNLQVYIDKKPDSYCFANQTREMTEDDILTMVLGNKE